MSFSLFKLVSMGILTLDDLSTEHVTTANGLRVYHLHD